MTDTTPPGARPETPLTNAYYEKYNRWLRDKYLRSSETIEQSPEDFARELERANARLAEDEKKWQGLLNAAENLHGIEHRRAERAEQQLAEAQKRAEGQAERILSLEHLHKQVNEHHFGVRELHVRPERSQLYERATRFHQQLAPHVKEREAAKLIRELLDNFFPARTSGVTEGK